MTGRRKLVSTIIVVFAGLVVIQFVPTTRDNPPPTGEIVAPPEVTQILKRSCYDCHSNETVWPWYSRIAPMSWLVTDHVSEGRGHLNFSMWQQYSENVRQHAHQEILGEVNKGEMPLSSYLILHPKAALSDADLVTLRQWKLSGTSVDSSASQEPSGDHSE